MDEGETDTTDAETTERSDEFGRRRERHGAARQRPPTIWKSDWWLRARSTGDYLEELLDLLDFDGDIDLDVEGDRAVVSIDGGDELSKLVGRKGRGAGRAPGADPAGGASEDRRAAAG